MSDVVIRVDNLGKKYRIRHQRAERYTALRDVIANKVRGAFQRPRRGSKDRPEVEDFWALQGVSFEVKRGEVVGIIGRNGAGKSTLLKILSRITQPTEGRAELSGRVASLLEVGTGFHPELTGRENIFLNGAILGMTRAEISRKFEEIVAFAEIEQFLDTPVKRYSSGMYVRLAFSVAAHLESEILIVDEVLAVGDAEFQKKCLGKINDVATSYGRTVLFVSHNMAAVQSLCGEGIFLERGGVKSRGKILDVLSAYAFTGPTKNKTTLALSSVVNQNPHFQKIAIDKCSYSFGETLRLSFELVSVLDARVAIEIEIRDERGNALAYCSTAPMYGTLIEVQAGCPTTTFIDVGPLPLAAGGYSIYFWLIKPWTETYDAVQEPLQFAIGHSDPGRAGFDFKQMYGRGAVTIPMRIFANFNDKS